MYSPGQRIKQIPFSMFSPEHAEESPGPEFSFVISSPEPENTPKVYEDSQDETNDLFDFDYTGKKKNVVMLDMKTLQEMFLKNLHESWKFIDKISIGTDFSMNPIRIECETDEDSEE